MREVTPVDEQYTYSDKIILCQTDKNGIITYVNKAFCEISGYSKEELLDQPHNIVRHPLMPKGVFEQLWQTIQSLQSWNGIIKNMRKDGKYYWVETEILPILDATKNLYGYISVQRVAPAKDISQSETTYKKMLENEKH